MVDTVASQHGREIHQRLATRVIHCVRTVRIEGAHDTPMAPCVVASHEPFDCVHGQQPTTAIIFVPSDPTVILLHWSGKSLSREFKRIVD